MGERASSRFVAPMCEQAMKEPTNLSLWYEPHEQSAFVDFFRAYEAHYDAIVVEARAWFDSHARTHAAAATPWVQPELENEELLRRLRAGCDGNWEPLKTVLTERGIRYAEAGISVSIVHGAAEIVRRHVLPVLMRSHPGEPGRVERAIFAMERFLDRAVAVVMQAYLETKEEQLKRMEELKAQSLELETQNRRIQEANRLKSEFLANMSHELRTPLNSIIGFAELLHDGNLPADAPEHREFLGDILKSGRHLLQLINDVLDLAKVEAGKIEFRPERVDMAYLLDEVTAVLRGIAAVKRLRLETELDPELEELTLDPSRLKQVLYNYASNAIKFTADGGRIAIRVRPESSDAFRVEVEDSGIGIASGDMGRLFVEFEQLDAGAAQNQGGTGLGLVLTKRIVEAQGGMVGVTSTLGQGSVFFAVLPRQPLRAASDAPVDLAPSC
jgi:signal transduction histidine kinase